MTRAPQIGVSLSIFFAAAYLSGLVPAPGRAAELDVAREIVEGTGVQGGFVVHLGSGDGKLTAALRINDRFLVHGLDADPRNVARSREHIRSLGIYGQVSADQLRSPRLPYIDNMVNLLVSADLGNVPMDEVMRVLAPGGVAYVPRDGEPAVVQKPRPDDIDEWTHFLHDASGNAVAHDDRVGPPRNLQWQGSPRWSRHHDRMASMSAMVSAGGRVIYVMDEGSRISIQMPPKWTLIARDAFNGTILWKQPIPTWQHHLWPLKSGPTQLARRLVATQDTVFVTLGFRAPLQALDAVTGKVVRTYEETAATEEVLYSDGVLFALVNKGESELSRYAPQHNVGDQARVRQEFAWNEMPRQIMAVDAATGEELWRKETKVVPLTLAADSQRVYYHDGEKLVCLNRTRGQPLWESGPAGRKMRITINFGPKLVIYQGVVLYAGGDRTMQALDAETGQQLWTAPHALSGYQSPEDLLVAGGLVWNAPTTRTQDTGLFKGRDPRTGEVKVEFPPDVETYWFHHRCYIAKATDKFLIPSRTGIEFVDPATKHWDINHWVRGGCLYGVMPCNGLVYAPPHNCACYPEAKLYGLNALAPAAPSRGIPSDPTPRLERGPAFGKAIPPATARPGSHDWPTYRHDNARSGFTDMQLPAPLKQAWSTHVGGDVSAPTIADGRVYVARIDSHSVHALDSGSGEELWSYVTGGRVDSPPTIDKGRVLFGSADGCVYCLRAEDGELVWRFRAAPVDRRLMALEQLESVWPAHGSVLVQNGEVWFAAGRSNFLDGGLRLIRLDVESGELLSETIMDEHDPETGEHLQARLKILQMPVGLTDILSSDGRRVFMRSQEFDLEGNRRQVGPHAGQPQQQGAVQRGQTAHLFAPMGFLDDTYFHRAYWVYGRSFAGGHAGYYQAAKFAPSGRLLVADDEKVYGFARKPQYLKWTTTIEHQLFAATKEPPKQAVESWDLDPPATRRSGNTNMVRFKKSKSLDPSETPLAVEAWVNSANVRGVVIAHGGPSLGYSLWIQAGKPQFSVRTAADQVTTVRGKKSIVGRWTHLVGALTDDRQVSLYVDGELVAREATPGLIPKDPAQSLEIGADDAGPVGGYRSPNALVGVVDEARVYHGNVTEADVRKQFARPTPDAPGSSDIVLSCSFDDGTAQDASGNENHGAIDGARKIGGKFAAALRFVGTRGRGGQSFVQHQWDQDVPLLARAMLKANDTLFVAGPPDLIDEESTFQRLVNRDPSVQAELAEQDEALDGKQGSLLLAVDAENGDKLAEYRVKWLPRWDGVAAANGQLYLVTTDGRVVCYEGE